jgi:hypothetical protein
VSYGRVTAPFSRAKKGDFHEVPFIDDADNILMRGDGPDQDKSGLVYFSPCERQALLEHIIESKIREAVHMKMLSPLTKIQVRSPCARASCDFPFLLPVYGCAKAERHRRMRSNDPIPCFCFLCSFFPCMTMMATATGT